MPRLKATVPCTVRIYEQAVEHKQCRDIRKWAWIINNGGETFAAIGTETSKGTKVFALTGKIKRGGLVEIPMGKTLRDVIFDIGGGIRGGKEFRAFSSAVRPGGCIPARFADYGYRLQRHLGNGRDNGLGRNGRYGRRAPAWCAWQNSFSISQQTSRGGSASPAASALCA